MKYNRETTIGWLESNRNNGFFTGFPEEDMNFSQMQDDELEYYFYEWVLPDVENQ